MPDAAIAPAIPPPAGAATAGAWLLNVPAAHVVHTAEPAARPEPHGHASRHALAFETVPAGHAGAHSVAPEREKLPGAHAAQTLAAVR